MPVVRAAHTSCCPWLSGPLQAPPVASPPDSGPGGGEQGDARGQPGQCPASAPSPPPQDILLTRCDGIVHLVPLAPGPAVDPDGCPEPCLCPLCPFPVGWAGRSWLLPCTPPCHGCTRVTSRLWPPSVSFPGGCPLGSPVPSNLSQWGSSQPVWGPSHHRPPAWSSGSRKLGSSAAGTESHTASCRRFWGDCFAAGAAHGPLGVSL